MSRPHVVRFSVLVSSAFAKTSLECCLLKYDGYLKYLFQFMFCSKLIQNLKELYIKKK